MLLSIITPYYKTLKYTKRLAKILEPQLSDDIEWIIIDDGCNELRLDELKAKLDRHQAKLVALGDSL